MLQIILIITTTIIFRHSVHILIFLYINRLPLLLIFLTVSLCILFNSQVTNLYRVIKLLLSNDSFNNVMDSSYNIEIIIIIM